MCCTAAAFRVPVRGCTAFHGRGRILVSSKPLSDERTARCRRACALTQKSHAHAHAPHPFLPSSRGLHSEQKRVFRFPHARTYIPRVVLTARISFWGRTPFDFSQMWRYRSRLPPLPPFASTPPPPPMNVLPSESGTQKESPPTHDFFCRFQLAVTWR